MARGGKREGAGRRPKTEGLTTALAHVQQAAKSIPSLGAAILGKAPENLSELKHFLQQYVPAEKLARRISEGLDAMETVFAKFEGKITDHQDVIAWGERRHYAELAAEMAGYHTPRMEVEHGGGIILHHAIPRPQRAQ